MTTVISVRGRERDELLADPSFVYVGRQVGRGRNFHWSGSDWGNPFKTGMAATEVIRLADRWAQARLIDRDLVVVFDWPTIDTETAVDLYRQWVLACPTLRSRLSELRGKTLGCWCGTWKPGDPPLACHARILAELAEEGGPR